MSDSTNPPRIIGIAAEHSIMDPFTGEITVEVKLDLSSTGATTESTSPITYVCGERNDKCVCIEDHHADTATDRTWHVCHQCGDEWYT